MNTDLPVLRNQSREPIEGQRPCSYSSLLIHFAVAFTLLVSSSCVKRGQTPGGSEVSSEMKQASMAMSEKPAMDSVAGTEPVMEGNASVKETKGKGKKEKPGDVDDQKDIALQAAADHEALFAESRYPSAATCGTCHPKHYKEWAVSSHAYAQLSPVYMSLNSEINELTSGTDGDFCLRCHSPVGANLGESPFISNLKRHPTSREGITCIACHRMNKNFNKRSGRLALVEGDLLQPIYGPAGNEELARVLDNTDKYRVVTEAGKPGRKIHREVKKFASMSDPVFCGTCHDVTLLNGFRLEEAFSEYRLSPAAKKGVSCQDCDMGKVEGIPSGYAEGPAAVIGGKPTTPPENHISFFCGTGLFSNSSGNFPTQCGSPGTGLNGGMAAVRP